MKLASKIAVLGIITLSLLFFVACIGSMKQHADLVSLAQGTYVEQSLLTYFINLF